MMKTFITLSTASILFMGGSAFARNDLHNIGHSSGRPSLSASSAEVPQGPVVHEMVINKDPALSVSSAEMIAPQQIGGASGIIPIRPSIGAVSPPPGQIITTQIIDWGGQCLWFNEDIDVKFGIPTILGFTMVSANITLKYSDVDFNDVSVWDTPEIDVVGIGDSSFSVDVLKGKEGQSGSTTWNALNQIQNDSASGLLGFQVDIDALHNEMYWCLNVTNATLKTVWQY
jgi:hypothetical protein